MAAAVTRRHPEWKALYDAIVPLIEKGETNFDYDILSKLAGVDVRGPRGRQQFYKFRAAIQESHRIWFENESGFGYVVIAADAHIKAAKRRVKESERKAETAKGIVKHVRDEKLTPEQRAMHAAYAAALGQLSKAFLSVSRKLKIEASPKRIKMAKLPKWEE